MKLLFLYVIIFCIWGLCLLSAQSIDGIWISQQDGSQFSFSPGQASIFMLGFDLSAGLFKRQDIKYRNISYDARNDTYYGENRCNDTSGAVHSWRPVSFKMVNPDQMIVTDLQSGGSIILRSSPWGADSSLFYRKLNGSWKRIDDSSIYFFYQNKATLSNVGSALLQGKFQNEQVKLRNIIPLSADMFIAENRQHNTEGALVAWERVAIIVENDLLRITSQKTGSSIPLIRINDTPAEISQPAPLPSPATALSSHSPELYSALPKRKTQNPNAIAVVIGNKDYKENIVPKVDFALNDAEAMKHYLINILGYDENNIMYIPNGSLIDFYNVFGRENNARGRLYNWVDSVKEAPDIFVYYSGHGAPELPNGDAYLVPVDCSSIDRISLNGYPVNLLYENLSKIPYKSLTVVLDACFCGNSEKGMIYKNISPVYLKSNVTAPSIRNATIITSASENQVAHWYPEKSHSVFTYYLLLGLKGEADLNKDKMVSSKELESYVSQKVYSYVIRSRDRTQSPSFKIDADKAWVCFE